MADARSPGELVHRVRCEHNARRERPFLLAAWEDRTDDQRAMDEEIAAAVAAAERERIRAAVLEVTATYVTVHGPGGGRTDDLIEGVRQVLDRREAGSEEANCG
jgi:hypothetical protein